MSARTVIPCKRPKVPVVDNKGTAASYCLVPGCEWKYGPGVKTDVEQRASWHRGEHRDAVPHTHIGGSSAHGFYGSCFDADGWAHWNTPEGCTTRTDVEATLAYHLSTEHGLVTCP